MLTMSLGPGTLAGVHVPGFDHGPFNTLLMVGFAAKFGIVSCGVMKETEGWVGVGGGRVVAGALTVNVKVEV